MPMQIRRMIYPGIRNCECHSVSKVEVSSFVTLLKKRHLLEYIPSIIMESIPIRTLGNANFLRGGAAGSVP